MKALVEIKALEIRIANLEEEIKTKTFELRDAEYSLKQLRERRSER